MNRVIIIIIAHRARLSELEEISLRQCFKVLGKYPIRLVCPKGLDISHYRSIIPNIRVDFINPLWQCNYLMFEHLKKCPFLYTKYSNYEYMLFYELDCFIFRDELEYWCDKGYDFIGAPWFLGFARAIDNKIIGVGNGGFSLRKIKNYAKISSKYHKKINPLGMIKDLNLRRIIISTHIYRLLNSFSEIKFLLRCFSDEGSLYEDIFWGHFVRKNHSGFRVAKPSEAMKFSFEVNPKFLYEKTNHTLPFGCHAWSRFDLDFWRPFIEKEGYDLSKWVDTPPGKRPKRMQL